MVNLLERQGFTERLKHSLLQAGLEASPSKLTRAFNLRWRGKPISTHAVRKWLMAEAIPTQEKLRTLAELLHVTPEWLRYGGDEPISASAASPPISPDEFLVLELYRELDAGQREAYLQLLRTILKLAKSTHKPNSRESEG